MNNNQQGITYSDRLRFILFFWMLLVVLLYLILYPPPELEFLAARLGVNQYIQALRGWIGPFFTANYQQ